MGNVLKYDVKHQIQYINVFRNGDYEIFQKANAIDAMCFESVKKARK